MRKFELTIATTPAELRSIASMLEHKQQSDPSLQMSVKVNWFHTSITFVHEKNCEVPEIQETNPDPLKASVNVQNCYVGSTIKDAFHLPTCFYATCLEHRTEWATEADARADGKQPCGHCLPHLSCSKLQPN